MDADGFYDLYRNHVEPLSTNIISSDLMGWEHIIWIMGQSSLLQAAETYNIGPKVCDT